MASTLIKQLSILRVYFSLVHLGLQAKLLFKGVQVLFLYCFTGARVTTGLDCANMERNVKTAESGGFVPGIIQQPCRKGFGIREVDD